MDERYGREDAWGGQWERPGRRHEAEALRERPTGELLKEFFENGQLLLKEEIRLAKAEARVEAKKAARAGAAFGAGGLFLHTALLLFAGFCVALLWGAMELWAAALIVFVVFAAIGVGAVLYGKKRLQTLEPDRTVRSLKEDKEWAKDTMQSIRSHRHANA